MTSDLLTSKSNHFISVPNCIQEKKVKKANLYSALYISSLSLKRSDMAVCNKGITQFYLPPTHEPYLSKLQITNLPSNWSLSEVSNTVNHRPHKVTGFLVRSMTDCICRL